MVRGLHRFNDRVLSGAAVALCLAAVMSSAEYSWHRAQAKVLPNGDLQWQPSPFAYEAGESTRYIDYENGSDDAGGTKTAPWKHHPWDAEATGKAASGSGIHTYVFKRGVIYRGALVPDESGNRGSRFD